MGVKTKKYTITAPLDATQASNIDEMFEDLYAELSRSLVGGTASGSAAYHEGDTIYFHGGVLTGLPISSTLGSFLRSSGTDPQWSTTSWPNAATTGQIVYASGTNAYGNLTPGTSGYPLLSQGAGAAPIYTPLDLTSTGVTGILPVASGGTGLGAFTSGSVVFMGSSGIFAQDNTNLFWDNTFNKRLRVPTIVGGTAVGQTLTLQSTSGVGTTDSISFVVGNNGGTVASTFNHDGSISFPHAVSINGDFLCNFFSPQGFNSSGTGFNKLNISNSTAGTGNGVQLVLGTDAINNFLIYGLSSTYTASGPFQPNGGVLANSGAGGLALIQTGTGDITFWTTGANVKRLTIATGGVISSTSAFRANGAVNGALGVQSGTGFVTGLVVQSAANDSLLEIVYTGSIFKISSSYITSEGYKPMTFWTSEAERLRLHTSGGVSIGNTTDPGNTNLSVTGYTDAVGFRVSGAATTGTILRGNGTNYVGSTLVAAGIAGVVASTFEKAETGTDANILTYTTGGTDEGLLVHVATDVSAITGTSIVVTVTWKDSNNSTATSTLTLTAVGDGTINLPVNAFASTNVVVSSVFVGVSTAYKISAFITRLK